MTTAQRHALHLALSALVCFVVGLLLGSWHPGGELMPGSPAIVAVARSVVSALTNVVLTASGVLLAAAIVRLLIDGTLPASDGRRRLSTRLLVLGIGATLLSVAALGVTAAIAWSRPLPGLRPTTMLAVVTFVSTTVFGLLLAVAAVGLVGAYALRVLPERRSQVEPAEPVPERQR